MSEAFSPLVAIQRDLKAPKNQENKFGGYKYRSAEDILNAVKPHLAEHNLILTMSDSIVEVGGRIYVKCTATLNGSINVSVDALAREPESRKGMDESQITGAASSYARKYALNGLFAIDDTKDADATNKHESEPSKAASKPAPKAKPAKPKEDPRVAMAKRIESGKDWIEVVAWTRGPLAGKTLSDAAANGEVKAIQDILDYLDPVALEHEEAVKRLKQALTEAKTMMDERGNAAKARGDEPDDDGIDRPF